eukprot:gb/GECG01012974.1/.p1 GENE.gb/GECG01012974.1/~~gb/GECG01012974.1/.p1  ORF type:complete len:263 (+),score=64.95 gb/GECG01012974.1/:1-789(+)
MYLGQVLRVNRRMGNLLTQLFGTKKHSQNDKSGSSKSTRATPEGRDKAEFELKKARDRIDKYIKRAEREVDQLLEKAKQMKKQGRDKDVMRLLKLKKLKQKAIDDAHQNYLKIQHVQVQIEKAENTREMYQGLEQGTAALEYLNEQMPIDKIEAIMEKTDEALEDRQAIDDFLNNAELVGEQDFYQGVEDEMDRMMKEDPDLQQSEAIDEATQKARTTEENRSTEIKGTSKREAASLPMAPNHEPRAAHPEEKKATKEAVAS